MANAHTTRFNVEIPGNPGPVKDKLKQLTINSCMVVGPDSPWATMLSDHLDKAHAPLFGVHVKQINFLVLGGLALSPEVASNGILIAFAVSDTDAERTSEVIRAFKQNDKDKEISAEAKQTLQADPSFMDLQNELVSGARAWPNGVFCATRRSSGSESRSPGAADE